MSGKHSEYIENFIEENLAALCEEYMDWSKHGILCDGALRQLARDFSQFYSMDTSQALTSVKSQLGEYLIRKKHNEFILN